MLNLSKLKSAFLITTTLSTCLTASPPFPSALKDANVIQKTITNIDKQALVIGNGDINALIWVRNGKLVMRVTKN